MYFGARISYVEHSFKFVDIKFFRVQFKQITIQFFLLDGMECVRDWDNSDLSSSPILLNRQPIVHMPSVC